MPKAVVAFGCTLVQFFNCCNTHNPKNLSAFVYVVVVVLVCLFVMSCETRGFIYAPTTKLTSNELIASNYFTALSQVVSRVAFIVAHFIPFLKCNT